MSAPPPPGPGQAPAPPLALVPAPPPAPGPAAGYAAPTFPQMGQQPGMVPMAQHVAPMALLPGTMMPNAAPMAAYPPGTAPRRGRIAHKSFWSFAVDGPF